MNSTLIALSLAGWANASSILAYADAALNQAIFRVETAPNYDCMMIARAQGKSANQLRRVLNLPNTPENVRLGQDIVDLIEHTDETYQRYCQ